MTTTFDIATSTPSLDDLLKLTAAGNEVLIVESGKLIARLVPDTDVKQKKTRQAGLQPGAVTFISDDFDDPLPEDFLLTGKP